MRMFQCKEVTGSGVETPSHPADNVVGTGIYGSVMPEVISDMDSQDLSDNYLCRNLGLPNGQYPRHAALHIYRGLHRSGCFHYIAGYRGEHAS